LKLNQKTRVPSLYVHGTDLTQRHSTSRSLDHRLPDLCDHPQSSAPGLLLLAQFSSLHAMPHLSVPCRPSTLAYRLESKTSKTYCHMLYRVVSCLPAQEGSDVVTCPTAQDPASLLGRAPRCHVSHGLGSCLPAREGSGAVTCPTALDPTSLLEMASVLPCVPWLWILPPYLGGFRRCHVSRGSGSCLHAQEGFGAVTYPMVPVPALYSGGLRCCHTSHNSLWVAYLKNKEMLR
jgi:hypothetical protein